MFLKVQLHVMYPQRDLFDVYGTHLYLFQTDKLNEFQNEPTLFLFFQKQFKSTTENKDKLYIFSL